MNTQEEIKRFIDECKSLENKDGHITQAIYKIEVDKLYKFTSGPFAEGTLLSDELFLERSSSNCWVIVFICNTKYFYQNLTPTC